jgi:hypothetical protein
MDNDVARLTSFGVPRSHGDARMSAGPPFERRLEIQPGSAIVVRHVARGGHPGIEVRLFLEVQREDGPALLESGWTVSKPFAAVLADNLEAAAGEPAGYDRYLPLSRTMELQVLRWASVSPAGVTGLWLRTIDPVTRDSVVLPAAGFGIPDRFIPPLVAAIREAADALG